MKMIKKITILTLTLILSATTFCFPTVQASYKLSFETNSDAVYFVNTDTDTVVYEKNADKQVIPASLTKIMTAIIALETIDDLEGTIVTAPAYIYDEFVGLGGVSNADIRKHEEVRMIDLLYALMLPSGCEAASIIADYIGEGNITEFVELMNKKAKEIGANDTHYTNAHGLHHENQKTTVHDMYLITKHALTIPLFEEISSSISYEMPATNIHLNPYIITHTNVMMSVVRGGDIYDPYVKGVKTGSLPHVGKNLISTASKNGYNYMLVTIGAPAKDALGQPLPQNGSFVDAKQLYEWAFSSFVHREIVRENESVGEISVRLGADQDHITLLANNAINALLPEDSDVTTIQRIKTLAQDVQAPIKKGTILGKMDLKLNDEIIATVDLIAAYDVERSTLHYAIDVVKRFLSNVYAQILLVILALLIIIFLIANARYRKIRRLRATRNRMMQRNK